MVLHEEQRKLHGTPGCTWKEKQHEEGPRGCTVPLWVFIFMALFVLCHTAVDAPHSTGPLAVSWCWQLPQPSLTSCRAGPAVISLGGERRPATSAPPAPNPVILGALAASGMEPPSPGAAQLLAAAGSCPASVKWGRKVTICSA